MVKMSTTQWASLCLDEKAPPPPTIMSFLPKEWSWSEGRIARLQFKSASRNPAYGAPPVPAPYTPKFTVINMPLFKVCTAT